MAARPPEFEDDGMLHVIEGMTRVVFDVSNNQQVNRAAQNTMTRKVMKQLGREVTDSVLT